MSNGLNYIASWDGGIEGESAAHASWDSLNSGVTGNMTLSVRALSVGPDGRVYAAGAFQSAGGVAANSIAWWDGEQWHPILDGLEVAPGSAVQAIAFDSEGRIYAGGTFRAVVDGAATWGGLATYHASQDDPSAWAHITGGPLSGVRAIAIDERDTVYVGGELSMDSRVEDNYVWRWNGQRWDTIGEVTSPVLPHVAVDALLIDRDGSLLVGGTFTHVAGVEVNGLARWDGAEWSAVGGGVHGSVRALALGPAGTIVVGGNFTEAGTLGGSIAPEATGRVALWDGTRWDALGGGVNDIVHSVAVDAEGRIYAGKADTRVSVWTGDQWIELPALATGSGAVHAVLLAAPLP